MDMRFILRSAQSALRRLSILFPSLWISSLFFTAAPANSAPISQEKPNAVSSSGCSTASDVTIIFNLLTYLVSNYGIHAASVPLGAEVAYDAPQVTRRRGWPWAVWMITCSLFLPLSTYARSLMLIALRYKYGADSALSALYYGALVVVVRAEDWMPSETQEVIYAQLPQLLRDDIKEMTLTAATADPQCLPITKLRNINQTAVFTFEKNEEMAIRRVPLDNHQLSGRADPPQGYSLAVPLLADRIEYLIEEQLQDTSISTVPSRQGYVSMILSLTHLVVGSYELYLSWSTEIPRWGYASYGLSVIPYLLMSASNFVCAAYVGSYSSGYLLRTPILDESSRRDNLKPRYEGTIGTPKDTRAQMTTVAQEGFTGEGYSAVEMQIQSVKDDTPLHKQLVVKKERRDQKGVQLWTATWYFSVDDTSGAKSAQPSTGSGSDVANFRVSALSHNGLLSERTGRGLRMSKPFGLSKLEGTAIYCINVFSIVLIPYLMIYGLTGFHGNNSSTSQRAWMMAWLAADQFSGISVAQLGSSIGWMRMLVPGGENIHRLVRVLLMTAAIGGFITLIRMYLLDHGYGSQLPLCS